MRVLVTLSVFNDKIKYRIRGSRLYCSLMKKELQRTRTLSKNDMIWRRVFQSELDKKKFIDNGRPINIVSELSNFNYDKCDGTSLREVNTSKVNLIQDKNSLKFEGENDYHKVVLRFDYLKAEKSLNINSCWVIDYYSKNEKQNYTQKGYLSIILGNYSSVLNSLSTEQLSIIKETLSNKYPFNKEGVM